MPEDAFARFRRLRGIAQPGVPGVVARKCTVRRIPRITLSWFVIQFY